MGCWITGTLARSDNTTSINAGTDFTDLTAPASSRLGNWLPYLTATGTGWACTEPGRYRVSALAMSNVNGARYEELTVSGTWSGTLAIGSGPSGYGGAGFGSVEFDAPTGVQVAFRYYNSGVAGAFRSNTRFTVERIGDLPVPAAPSGLMAVYGDSWAAETSVWGSADPVTGWPATVGRNLGLTVANHAVGGTGYRQCTNNSSVPYAVTVHPEPTADVVVVFGSLNDRDLGAEPVREGALVTYSTIRAAHPNVPVLAIGPQWTAAAIPTTLPAIRDAIHSACATAGVTHVDALQWMQGHPELIGPDGLHPNTDGHAYLAGIITPLVQGALHG